VYSTPPLLQLDGWDRLSAISVFGWLVADGWCWFVLREEYCWLVAAGWFVVREKYCWLVADKSSEHGAWARTFTGVVSTGVMGWSTEPQYSDSSWNGTVGATGGVEKVVVIKII
jgi:hypothetical protein